ncbi:hypothetical protein CC79DRAFT_454614 [Sarocladium strictum]
MVGVPRSNGCGLCVQRRVKCDQGKPACEKCSRYGAVCPGYQRDHKFVSNKHQIRPRRRQNQSSSNSSSGSSTSSTPRATNRELQARSRSNHEIGDEGLVVFTQDIEYHQDVRIQARAARVPAILPESRGPFINTMLDTLNAGLSADELAFVYPWFQGVGEYVGAKVTLDSAVTSLILQMLGRRFNDHRMIAESHYLYGRSLNALQVALNSKTEWRTTETLCTTVLLCHFEMFAGTGDALSWMKHADALALLIEKRGPEAYTSDWDLSIFNTSRTAIVCSTKFSLTFTFLRLTCRQIFNCFWSGKDCFFAGPSWESVLKHGGSSRGLPLEEAQRRALVNDYVMILAKLPGIMRRVYPLFMSRSQGFLLPAYAQNLSSLGDEIDGMYRSLLLWSERLYADMPLPTEVATADETSPWPTVLAYENVWFGALYMGFWTVRVILQLGLELTKDKDATFEDSQVLVSNILRSCETVGQGIMGPYRIGFGIRVAYDLADAPTRLWIKTKLAAFQETSASLDASLFVSPDERTPS